MGIVPSSSADKFTMAQISLLEDENTWIAFPTGPREQILLQRVGYWSIIFALQETWKGVAWEEGLYGGLKLLLFNHLGTIIPNDSLLLIFIKNYLWIFFAKKNNEKASAIYAEGRRC